MSDEDIRRFGRELERSGQSPVDVALGLVSFFRVSWTEAFGASVDHWLVSPAPMSKDDFRALTHSLVKEASRRAVAAADAFGARCGFVGWADIVRHVALLLEADHGFRLLRDPVESFYVGPGIIRAASDLTADDGGVADECVLRHNLEALRRTESPPGGCTRGECLPGMHVSSFAAADVSEDEAERDLASHDEYYGGRAGWVAGGP